MIVIDHLTKRYGDTVAVRDLNLRVEAGEFFAFLGPNGAGKTTTLKVLAGLLRPSEGRTFIDGHDVQREPEAAKAVIGYIPDQPYLYEKLTGREFFRFIGDLFRIPPRRQDERMDFFFALFGLEEMADQLIENYSHGMRQKLVFSVALLHDPKAIIVDEPMVGLDPRSARLVKNLLKERTRAGATVFLSTHTLSVAEELADRIAIIDHGRLTCLGTLAQLRTTTNRDGNLEDLFLQLTASEFEA